MFNGRRRPSCDGTSRMTRECQVRICERLGVKFPGPTRPKSKAQNEQMWPRILTRPNTRFHIIPIHYISLPCSSQKSMSISRYIFIAVARFSRACSGLPVRR
jgi:hypothetical protein